MCSLIDFFFLHKDPRVSSLKIWILNGHVPSLPFVWLHVSHMKQRKMWVYVTAFASTLYKTICKTISFLHFKINLENNLFYNKYLQQFFPCTETWEHEVPDVIPHPEYKISWRGLNNAFFFLFFLILTMCYWKGVWFKPWKHCFGGKCSPS